MDFTGFVLAAFAGLLGPPILMAGLWRLSRRQGAPRPARVWACAGLALLGTLLIAAMIGVVWDEREAVLAASFVAPATLAASAAVALRGIWGWALLPLGLLACWFAFEAATS